MIKIDFHTHSSASPDGGISALQYKEIITRGLLDVVAITDHNRIDFALDMHQEFGDKIIVGEEIMTSQGEIIGLYLNEPIVPHMPAMQTAKAIKQQGGLIYIPHPFENVRKGLSQNDLDELVAFVDIVEVQNGRAVFQNKGPEAAVWCKLHRKLRAASSDAHNLSGIGSTYTVLETLPVVETLKEQLETGRLVARRPPLISLLSPKANRLKRRLKERGADL